MNLRLLRMGLSTLLGIRRQGYFIPYRYADAVPGPGEVGTYEAIGELFTGATGEFKEVLAAIDGFADALTAIGEDNPPAPRWTQSWFPRLDAAAAYALVRTQRPKRIVEVGSGHSTRFLARAVGDEGLDTAITCIDPAPRAIIEGLDVKFVRDTVHRAGGGPFRALGAGDMLFVDSSHILMPGSDVDLLLNRILPTLPAGVLVHIHDVFLPDDYPTSWAWRGYNEQQAVAVMLSSAGYRLRFASRYVATRMAAAVDASVLARLPLVGDAFENSLWLEKVT